MIEWRLDIEIYTNWGEDVWPQAKYLVHGCDDVLWTNSIDDAVEYLRADLEALQTVTPPVPPISADKKDIKE